MSADLEKEKDLVARKSPKKYRIYVTRGRCFLPSYTGAV